jgi:hypothetical protein
VVQAWTLATILKSYKRHERRICQDLGGVGPQGVKPNAKGEAQRTCPHMSNCPDGFLAPNFILTGSEMTASSGLRYCTFTCNYIHDEVNIA